MPSRSGTRSKARPALLDTVPSARRPWWKSAWTTPLWVHAIALGLLLVALIPVSRFDASFSSDEGTVILQAKRLAAGQSYLRPNELPSIDPEGKAFFVTLSEGGPDQFATYAKHPAYAWWLALADKAGGTFTMTLISVFGTLLAAVAGALIARRWDRSLDRWALWILGVGSPLLFDSQIVLAHSFGAACAGFAALWALTAVEHRSWPSVGGICAALAVAAFFRSEVLLFALALSSAIGMLGIRKRRFDLVIGAVAVTGSCAVATFLDRYWVGRVLARSTAPLTTVGQDFLAGRLGSAAGTFILPGATWPPVVYFGLLGMLVALIGTALIARRQPLEASVFRVGCVVVAVGGLLPLFATPDTIGSLLITCPVLTAGWCLLSRDEIDGSGRRVAISICVIYTFAVLATQYSEGGAAEWGARYLALMLPVAVPVSLLALKRVRSTLPTPDRRLASAALAVVTISMAIISVASLRHYRTVMAEWLEQVDQAQRVVSGPDLGDGDRRPIVVTTWSGLGRMTWPLENPPRGISIPAGSVQDYARVMREQGVTEFVFATIDPRGDLEKLRGTYEPVASFPPGRLTKGPVFVMRSV